MHEAPNNRDPEREGVLFNAAVRALGRFGYTQLQFDIGGKKSRRRYITAESPEGEHHVIWFKTTSSWRQMAEAIRFPWKKLRISPDGVNAVSFACEAAASRGVTHLLGVVGDDSNASLTFARLYKLIEVTQLASRQSELIDSVFYRAHSSSLILVAYSKEFETAAEAAAASGTNILHASPYPRTESSFVQEPVTVRVARPYPRDPKVRKAVLRMANGRCECCGEPGFLTEGGERYLETHHVVGLGERGPDSTQNVVAVCPLCHRKAHFAADKLDIERRLMESLRRRKWSIG